MNVTVVAPFALTRAVTLERVAARLIELTPDIAQSRIDALWWNDSGLNIQKREADQHWNWEQIAGDYSANALRESVAVLSSEDYLEGALTYRFDAKSRLEPGNGCVYIGWLASAPRNRKWICAQPSYAGVGGDLMEWAVRESTLNGLGGRLSLQSLPTPQTVRFYEAKGFVRTNPNQPPTGLIDYELPQDAAQKWLQQLKQ